MAKKLGKLASRYARAFLSAVEKEQPSGSARPTRAQEFAAVLSGFSDVWKKDSELRGFLESPMFELEAREKALGQIADSIGLPPILHQFLKVILVRGRISSLPEIAAAFARTADTAAGVVQVAILTASEVNPSECREIEEVLRKKIGGEPRFNWAIDKTLLGGMVIEYDGKILDGSLNGRLQRIERSLV